MGKGLDRKLVLISVCPISKAIEVRDLRTEMSPGECRRDIQSGGLSSPPDATVGALGWHCIRHNTGCRRVGKLD